MRLNARTKSSDRQATRYLLTGAAGDYARTLVFQTKFSPRVSPSILCDLDTAAVVEMCTDIGISADRFAVATTTSEVSSIVESGKIAIVSSLDNVPDDAYDVLVEATGSPDFGLQASVSAIESGKNVAMVSKEVDSVAGLALKRLALDHGVRYEPALGDQPANLINLCRWAEEIGLDIVAVGKSSEYDLVFDHSDNSIQFLDSTATVKGFGDLWHLDEDIKSTLSKRAEMLREFEMAPGADYCEMSVVANHLGLSVDTPEMHYPVLRTTELADAYALEEDGGIIRNEGCVDVFRALRHTDEPSFAGGVFIVARTEDKFTWDILRTKGHVLSRNGKYAAFYLPYHFMGVETPAGIDSMSNGADRYESPSKATVIMAGKATTAIPAGTSLKVSGHHHDIAGIRPILINASEAERNTVPFYMLDNTTVIHNTEPGDLLSFDSIDGTSAQLLAAWDQVR